MQMKKLEVTRVVYMRDVIALPEWMIFAMNGEKINAIKSLREHAGIGGTTDTTLSLTHARRIVEGITNHTSSVTGNSNITNFSIHI